MKKIAILILYLIIIFISLNCKTEVDSNKNILAKEGILDLTGIDLQTQSIDLKGEWKLGSGLGNQTEYGKTNVPGFWESSEVDGLKGNGNGIATYNLEITGLEPGEYSIKFLEIQNAFLAKIDDIEFLEFGKISADKKLEIRKIGRPIISFKVTKNKVKLTLIISNWFEARGGIRNPPEFSSKKFLEIKERTRRNFDFISFGALVFFGLSSLFFYLITREEKSPLRLSLVCTILAIRIFFTEEHYIFEYLPNLNPILEFRIDMASMFLLVGFFTQYFQSLFPEDFKLKNSRTLLLVPILYLLFFGFINGKILEIFFNIFLIYTFLIMIIVLYATFKALRNNRLGARIFLSSMLVFVIGGSNDILSRMGIIHTKYISHYTFLLFISFQSALISYRYKYLLDKTDLLNKELDIKFRSISATVQEAILVLDNTGKLIFGNNGAVSIFGLDLKKLFTYKIDSLITNNLENNLNSLDFILSETWKGTKLNFEFIGKNIKNLEFPIEVSFTFWDIYENRYYGLIVRDITIRKNLEIERDKALKTLQEDLITAEKLQHSMFPIPNPDKYPFLWEAVYIPMSHIGGDIYDIKEVESGVWRFFLADATGHGTQAALLTMAIKADYDALDTSDNTLGEILEKLNNKIYPLFFNLNSFFTAFVLELDLNKNEIRFASGGHVEQILLLDGKLILLESTGALLCLKKNSKYKTKSYSISKGAEIFLFSDGVFELFDSENKELFGEEKLYEHFLNSKSISLKEKIISHKNNLYDYCKSEQLDDDFTMIGIRV